MIVHANSVEAWKYALAARADILAHGLWQWSGVARMPSCQQMRVR